jgi:hypothetical protein
MARTHGRLLDIQTAVSIASTNLKESSTDDAFPRYLPELKAAHKELNAMKKKTADLEEKLRDQYGEPRQS